MFSDIPHNNIPTFPAFLHSVHRSCISGFIHSNVELMLIELSPFIYVNKSPLKLMKMLLILC